MKIKGLILTLFLVVATGSVNATTIATSAGAVAAANAQAAHRIEQEHTNSAIYSVKNALENRNRVLVPCKPKYIGGLFDRSRIDRELTVENCDAEKKEFEQLNGVKYRFGKAVSHDHNGFFYFELVEME